MEEDFLAARIGDILIQLGYLTSERLAQANIPENGDSLRYGERLCQHGLVREDDIAHALAVQSGVEFIHFSQISQSEISPEVFAFVPADLAERYRVLPIAVHDGHLEWGMANPFDWRAIEDLAAVSGLEIIRRYMRPT